MTRKDGGNGLEGQFLSSLFLVTRKGVGNGLVANLKKRNKSITYQHLKMKGLFLSKEMLKPRDKICKIGLKDAFSKDESFFVTALQVVGNKVKRRISNRVFQENKARQIFRKTNISYPLICGCSCVYQGVRILEKLGVLCFLETVEGSALRVFLHLFRAFLSSAYFLKMIKNSFLL